jgi:hypothetical protein
MAGVWGVLIYLVFQLIKIKRIGRKADKDPTRIVAGSELAYVP